MKSGVKTKRLKISGMTCINCQSKIEKKLRYTAGVKSVKVSYHKESAEITYDSGIVSLKDISAAIEKLDYRVLTGNEKQIPDIGRIAMLLVIVVLLYVLLQQFGILNLLVPSRLADAKMGYGMLFIIGLLTSVHCITMCGGINLSQCVPSREVASETKTKSRMTAFAPAFLYNLGRVLAYTVIGFILGLVGLLLGSDSEAGLPMMLQGILKLIAGAFMVVMGINMMGLFPWLRKLQPHMPKLFVRKFGSGESDHKAVRKSPLIVGLLNGLMPCGPMQSMQIVALASGNPFVGAVSMFLFSLGTVPLMLGLGSIVSALGKRFAEKVMVVGAVLVVVLGLAMLSQGGILSGLLPPGRLLLVILVLCAVGIVSCIPFEKSAHKIIGITATLVVSISIVCAWSSWSGSTASNYTDGSIAQIVDGKQIVSSTLSPGSYPDITVEMGMPVEWTINAPADSINGCNNRINIQEYGIANYSFRQGDNVIEFIPDRAGTFQYSCWMGMIRGSITVVE